MLTANSAHEGDARGCANGDGKLLVHSAVPLAAEIPMSWSSAKSGVTTTPHAAARPRISATSPEPAGAAHSHAPDEASIAVMDPFRFARKTRRVVSSYTGVCRGRIDDGSYAHSMPPVLAEKAMTASSGNRTTIVAPSLAVMIPSPSAYCGASVDHKCAPVDALNAFIANEPDTNTRPPLAAVPYAHAPSPLTFCETDQTFAPVDALSATSPDWFVQKPAKTSPSW
mmetsp:Transcript_3684/g.11623  ORF Transcript_3684/g.11623 Transcript_3684/m.11623 type:complete len:226 (+) Transcript_3684:317-994(+)